MRTVISKILSVTMAFVVLFSTVSFSVGKHYCGDILVDVAVFKAASSCGMELNDSTQNNCTIAKKNCCQDVQIVIEGQVNLKDTSLTSLLTPVKVYTLIGFVCASLNKFEEAANRQDIFKEYIPPLLVWDLQILDQTFLI